MNSAVRRWVAVVTGPSSSEDVSQFKLVFWAGLAMSVFEAVSRHVGQDWPVLTAPAMPWVYLLLRATRQRDEARTRLCEALERSHG